MLREKLCEPLMEALCASRLCTSIPEECKTIPVWNDWSDRRLSLSSLRETRAPLSASRTSFGSPSTAAHSLRAALLYSARRWLSSMRCNQWTSVDLFSSTVAKYKLLCNFIETVQGNRNLISRHLQLRFLLYYGLTKDQQTRQSNRPTINEFRSY